MAADVVGHLPDTVRCDDGGHRVDRVDEGDIQTTIRWMIAYGGWHEHSRNHPSTRCGAERIARLVHLWWPGYLRMASVSLGGPPFRWWPRKEATLDDYSTMLSVPGIQAVEEPWGPKACADYSRGRWCEVKTRGGIHLIRRSDGILPAGHPCPEAPCSRL